MYLLIFLNLTDEFFEVCHIDEAIYAKLPTVEFNFLNKLTRIVTTVILYGPYSEINSHSPYIIYAQDGFSKYTKHYFCNF